MHKATDSAWRGTLMRYRYGVIGFACILIGLLAIWISGLHDVYIPTLFTYSADIAVTRKDYSATAKEYSKNHFSIGTYAIQETGITRDVASLHGSIDITDVNNMHVGKVSRDYVANTKTGEYVDASQTNPGYVFAPRGLHEGQSFNYRQIMYPAVASTEYFGKETIDGVEAYRYHVSYEQSDMVPVDDVTSVRLPAGQELRAAPRITLWVEPQTGWLLKYREESTVSVYDTATYILVAPLYHFTAGFTDATVHQQARYAQGLRTQLLVSHRIVPGVLLGLVLLAVVVVLLRRFGDRPMSGMTTGALMTVLALSTLSFLAWFSRLLISNTWFQRTMLVNPLTALCLMLVALCALALYKRRWRWVTIGAAVFVASVGFLQTLSSLGVFAWRPDLVLFHDELLPVAGPPLVRMLPIASFLLMLAGIVCVWRALDRKTITVRFMGLASAVIYTVALAGVLAKVLGFDQAFSLDAVHGVSVAEWLLFLLMGLALSRAVYDNGSLVGDVTTSVRNVVKTWVRQGAVALPVLAIALLAQLQYNTVEQQLQSAFQTKTSQISQRLHNELVMNKAMLERLSAIASSNVDGERAWQSYATVLVRGALQDVAPTVDVTIYDGVEAISSNTLYSTTNTQGSEFVTRMDAKSLYILPTRTETIYIEDHPLVLYSTATSDFEKDVPGIHTPELIWVIGSSLYMLLALFVNTNKTTQRTAHRMLHRSSEASVKGADR
jgi:multisubunit Na+/H+ antiporter MnhF subunit